MTFLKKLGSIAAKALPIILGIAGVVLPSISTNTGTAGTVAKKVLGDLNNIPQLVVTAEAMIQAGAGAKTGAAKLAAVTPYISTLFQEYMTANFPGAGAIKNQQLFNDSITQIANGVVGAMNSFDGNPS